MKTVRIYKNNFIKQVIARVDFESPQEFVEADGVTGLPEGLRTAFPRIEERDLQTQQVTLSFERQARSVSQTVSDPMKLWLMRSASDPGHVIELCRDYASLTASTYERFSEFTPPFYALTRYLADRAGGDLAFRRVGLRYIDHIDVPGADPEDWQGLISPDLTGALRFGLGTGLLRAMTRAEYGHGDARIQVQFGMPNPDFPASVSRHFFVLDIDGFVASRTLLTDLPLTLEQLNHLQYDYFEAAIEDGLRAKMEIVVEELADGH